jgi:hypothetical protein
MRPILEIDCKACEGHNLAIPVYEAYQPPKHGFGALTI